MRRQVVLGDLIAPAKLRRAGDSNLPILSMTMRGGLVDQADKFKKRIASTDTSPYKRVLRDQLVVGFPIDEGVLSFQALYDEAIVSPAYDVWDIRQATLVVPGFLERVLRSPRALAFYKSKLQGTTARRRTIPDDLFLSLPIALPDLTEQVEVLTVLDMADGLRRKRQEAIRLADEFLRAVFIDMFGDPAVNSKSLPKRRLEELCQVATGATPSRDRSDFFGGPHPWVKTGEVDCPMILSAEENITDSAIRETNCKLFPPGTVLVAMYGQGKTRGKVGMLGIPAATNQACAAILPSASISHHFVYAQLSLMYEHLRAMGRGGNQENLNLGMIKSLEVLVPPKADVERYLLIRERADALLTKARLAQEDAALLSSSLTSLLLG
jgi:type I restriction enzyme S subunit